MHANKKVDNLTEKYFSQIHLLKFFHHHAETSPHVVLNLHIQCEFKLAYDQSPKMSNALSRLAKYEIRWREKYFKEDVN